MVWHHRIFPRDRSGLNVTLDSNTRALRDRIRQNANQPITESRSVKRIEQALDVDVSQNFLTSKHLFEQRKLFEQKEKNKFTLKFIQQPHQAALTYFQRHHPLYRPITKELAEQWQRHYRHISPLSHEKKELRRLSNAINQIRAEGTDHKAYPELIEKYLDMLQAKMIGTPELNHAVGPSKIFILLAGMRRTLEKNAQTELAKMVGGMLEMSRQTHQLTQMGMIEKSEQAGNVIFQTMMAKGEAESAYSHAQAVVFFEAHRQAQEIRSLTEKIVDHLQQDSAHLQQEASQALYKAMNLLVLIFDAKADFYLKRAQEINTLHRIDQYVLANQGKDIDAQSIDQLHGQNRQKLSDSVYLKPWPYTLYAEYRVIQNQLGHLWNFETKHPYLPVSSMENTDQHWRYNVQHGRHQLFKLASAFHTTSSATTKSQSAIFWPITVLDFLTKTKMAANVADINLSLTDKQNRIRPSNVTSQHAKRSMTFAHQLLSVAQTYSCDMSLQLARQVCEAIWLAKSHGDSGQLPPHLKTAYSLIQQVNEFTPNEEYMCTLLDSANDALSELNQHFSQFSSLAPAFIKLLESNIWRPDVIQRYQLLSKKISAQQFLADQLPSHQPYQLASAKEAIGRIWDAYSVALGVIETAIAYSLAKYDAQATSRSQNLALGLQACAIQYQKFAQALTKEILLVSLENVSRYHSLVMQKEMTHPTDKLSSAPRASTTTTDGNKVETIVEQHTNPLHRGIFNTQVTIATPDSDPILTIMFGNHSDLQASKTQRERYGELQYIAFNRIDSPNSTGSTPAFSDRSQIMLGSELAYQILKFPEIKKDGLTEEVMTQAKKLLLTQNTIADPSWQKLFDTFFKKCQDNMTTRLTYFGLNGISNLLKNFADFDSTESMTADSQNKPFELIGLNVFTPAMLNAYAERKKMSQYSAQNNFGLFSQDQAIDAEALIGISPQQVKALLAQSAIGMKIGDEQTVTKFFDHLTPEQRTNFYRDTEIGRRLFITYLSIINAAQEIKNVLHQIPISISETASRFAGH